MQERGDTGQIELQAGGVPLDAQGGIGEEMQPPRLKKPHRIVKFLQPDGTIWEYEDNFVEPDEWKNPNNMVADDQYTQEIQDGRDGDQELLIQ